MSILEEALKKEKLKLQRDVLPPEQRTVKDFARLIQSLRAIEADFLKRLGTAESERNNALHDNLKLHERVRQLETEVVQLRLKNRMEQIPALSTTDKNNLLEASAISNGS